MKYIKNWLYNRFLPAWCRDMLLEDNARLQGEVEARDRTIRELRAYIDGMETAIRRQSRIYINAKGAGEAGIP